VLDDKRRGWVAAPAVIVEASSRVRGSSLASVALEGNTYITVTPAAVEVNAGVIADEMTDIQVVQRMERSSGRGVSPPRLAGAGDGRALSVSVSLRRRRC